MTVLAIPGPLDPHVHLRDADWAHKGTVASETAAALAGGYWAVVDMPNTPPTPTDPARLTDRLDLLARDACSDVGLWMGAGAGSWPEGFGVVPASLVGLKLYLDATTGTLKVATVEERDRLVGAWQVATPRPIAVHAEGTTLASLMDLVRTLVGPRVHVCHVSTREEVTLIRRARADGLPVTAGVTPHHLVLTRDDEAALGARADVRPRLGSVADRDALWAALTDGTIDCVESDHAPHTLVDKASATPPHGVPGLETTLPLLGQAVHEGRLTAERLVEIVASAPHRITGLVPPAGTETLLDLDASWVIEDQGLHTAVGWSPFAGMRVHGRVREVRIGGRLAFDGERVLRAPGAGALLQPGAGPAA